MVLQRWDPLAELRRMESTMNRAWRGFASRWYEPDAEGWGIPLDVVEEGDEVVVQASLPGLKAEEIDVSIDDGVLTIRGQTSAERERKSGGYLMQERRSGTFYRSLRLPDSLDQDKVKPVYKNGVLTVAFPKLASKTPKRLTVKVEDSDSPADSEKK